MIQGHHLWVINTLRAKQNGHHLQNTFSNHFSKWKVLNFGSNFIEIWTQQCSIIGLDDGLALIRWQAISWTNDGLVYIYMSLSLNELIAESYTYDKHRVNIKLDSPIKCDSFIAALHRSAKHGDIHHVEPELLHRNDIHDKVTHQWYTRLSLIIISVWVNQWRVW